MPVEREIKLRFSSAAEARGALLAIGATPLRPRRLQRDVLLDDAAGSLRASSCALRVRDDGGVGYLTFKGPPQPGAMKLREELETSTGNSALTLAILERTGFTPRFRYEKYREEFALGPIVAAIDETPLGTLLELEGTDEQQIDQIAQRLGRGRGDYVTLSYRELFAEHCTRTGLTSTDMLFARPPE